MGERLLLVNPKKPPSKRRKTRSAAQKAATKKLIAHNKRRRNPTKTGAANMAKRKSKKRRTAAQKSATRKLVALNRRGGKPAKRRRRNPAPGPSKRRSAYRNAVAQTAPKRRRRNPIRRTGILENMVMPAASAATGALAIDVLWAYLPIPEQFKNGNLKHVTKAAGAVALSMLAEMVVSKKTAQAMGVGALTVVFHQAAKDLIATTMPALKMDGIGYYNPALPVGTLVEGQLGYYPGDNGNANASPTTPSSANTYDSEMGYYAK